MGYEVETKYRIEDIAAVKSRLDRLGTHWSPPICQSDAYYAHPSRDFASTDEALRIRSVAEANYITYKGPKIDSTTKTRREIELPLSSGEPAAADFGRLLVALGFSPVATVVKRRHPGILPWENRQIEVALDEVDGVGSFVELELMAEESQLDSARACLASAAGALRLTLSERRSYLELLLANSEGFDSGQSTS